MSLSQLITNDQGISISNKLDQLKDTISPIKPLLSKGAALHNSIYRGKDLTDIYDLYDISQKMQNGDFEDLYIGDYVTLKLPYQKYENGQYVTKYRYLDVIIAAFDWYLGNYNEGYNVSNPSPSAYNTHHVVFVTGNAIEACRFEEMITYDHQEVNGYADTRFFKEYVTYHGDGTSYREINDIIGASSFYGFHDMQHMELLSNSVNNGDDNLNGSVGCSDGYSAYYPYFGFLSEMEVFGESIYSSSIYDNGEACRQLPLFALNPESILLFKNSKKYRSSYDYDYFGGETPLVYYLRSISRVTKKHDDSFNIDYNSVHFCTCGQYFGDDYESEFSGSSVSFMYGNSVIHGVPGYDIYGQDNDNRGLNNLNSVNNFDIRLKFIVGNR